MFLSLSIPNFARCFHQDSNTSVYSISQIIIPSSAYSFQGIFLYLSKYFAVVSVGIRWEMNLDSCRKSSCSAGCRCAVVVSQPGARLSDPQTVFYVVIWK
jgi:hypothetical protein